MSHEEKKPPETLRELLGVVLKPAKEFFEEPMPEGVSLLHTTGSMCLFLAGMQILTGILMALYYTPSPQAAWESVDYVREKVAFGPIIHGLHHWGSSAFVVMVFLHMLRVFVFAAYKGSRKWTWLAGVGLLGVVFGFGFTGYLLPWDMKAYFGTQVGTKIAGSAPVVGPWIRSLLLGGEEISELTLPRFYAVHTMILPAALVGLIGVHVFLVRLYGITPPWKRDGEPVEHPHTFFPDHALRDSMMICLLLCTLLGLAWLVGADLERKADPAYQFYAPHPEWYFLGMQQLLRYFPGSLLLVGTVVLPGLGALLLISLPFIDRNPERKLSKRPIALGAAGVIVVTMITLTLLGYRQLQIERKAMAAEEAKDKAREVAAAPAAPKAQSAATTATAPPTAPAAYDPSAAEAGRQLYDALDCAKCHANEKAGKGLNVPPTLDYAGDRFTPEWMMKYLKEVPPRRFEKKGKRPLERMPDFKLSAGELNALTAHLMTMKKPEHMQGIAFDPAQSTPEKVKAGETLFNGESCGVCHALNGQGGKGAPDLTGVGSRLRPEFIFAMIKIPQTFVPDTTMDNTLLGDDEVRDLTFYLMTQK